MNYNEELMRSIQTIIDKRLVSYRADRTYKSVVKKILPKGYVVLDDTGSERTVPCRIPALPLREGQLVWLTEPLGNLRELHISGIAGT